VYYGVLDSFCARIPRKKNVFGFGVGFEPQPTNTDGDKRANGRDGPNDGRRGKDNGDMVNQLFPSKKIV